VVSIVRDTFVGDIQKVVGSYGLSPELAMVVFPFKLFIPGGDMSLINDEKVDELVKGLTEWQPAAK
jgi:hypothetical protein